MLQLKFVRLPVLDATVNVNVAWIDCPAFKTEFSRFHDRFSEELALGGFQLLMVMDNISGTVPVFLM